jgi:hypothetical protein
MSGSHNIKLSLEQRQNIVKMHSKGITVVSLADQFGVSRPTIYNVLEKMGKTNHKKNEFYFDKSDENKDMSDLIVEPKTIFGVTIDIENGSSNPKIRKALDKSFQLLDIMKFIEVTKFKLNMTMFDYFWQVVVGKVTGVHLSSSILEWFGYEGVIKDQKQAFTKMLKRNGINYRHLVEKDKEVELYPTIQEELQLIPSNVQHSKFLIMEPDDLKMAIMQLKTKNGHIIRQYYIDLEKLLKMYTEYTLYFNHREATRKITDLEQMMSDMRLDMKKQEKNRELERQKDRSFMRSLGISLEEVKDQNEELLDETKNLTKQNTGLKKEVTKVQRKLGIAVEDRAPQPEDESKRERFVLLKYNDPEYTDYYYTIRAQDTYTTRKLKIKKVHFPDLVVLLDFKCSPNSKTLYNRIKENLKAKNVVFKGNNIGLEDSQINEEELIDEMKIINDQKYDV